MLRPSSTKRAKSKPAFQVSGSGSPSKAKTVNEKVTEKQTKLKEEQTWLAKNPKLYAAVEQVLLDMGVVQQGLFNLDNTRWNQYSKSLMASAQFLRKPTPRSGYTIHFRRQSFDQLAGAARLYDR